MSILRRSKCKKDNNIEKAFSLSQIVNDQNEIRIKTSALNVHQTITLHVPAYIYIYKSTGQCAI